MNRIGIGFIMSLLVLNSMNGFAFEWRSDLDKAMDDGKKFEKPLLVFFCYHLANTLREDLSVWQSPIFNRYESTFITVKVDVDDSASYIKEYGLLTFPCVLFFDGKGRELLSLRWQEERLMRGYLFQRIGKVVKNIEEFALLESQLELFKNDPKMILLYARGLRDRAQFEAAEQQYSKLLKWDGLDPQLLQQARQDYATMVLMNAGRDFYHSQFDASIQRLQAFLASNKDMDYELEAKVLLGKALFEAGSAREGERILKEVIKKDTDNLYADSVQRFIDRKKGK
jgi:tetratricopeptide (TPR) repeat protein